MPHHASRRTVLGFAGAAAASAAFAAEPDAPDLVVLNANVLTVDPKRPKAQAFAVRGDRFVAVGASDEIRALAGPRTRIYDAKGMTVVPGFIDCHNHAPGEMLLYEVLVGNPFEVEFVTIDSIVEKLQAKARTLPPDTWVEGFFFDDTKVKDRRQLDVRDLDRVSTTHPVCVNHRGGHTAFYNSRALAMAGVTRDTANPPGGTFDRDASGAINGRVTDTAMAVVDKVGQRPAIAPAEAARRARDGAAHISKQFARYGLTTVHHQGGDLGALQDVRARGDLRHRVSYEAVGDVLEAMIRAGLKTGFGDDWIRLGATFEHTVDGSFSERTLAWSKPFPGRTPPYYGNLVEDQPALNAWVERVHRARIDVNCHANGDVAIGNALTAMERAQKLFPRPEARFKLTHCTLVNDDLVRRIKALDATPACFTTYAYYNSDKFGFYGPDFMAHAMAFRSFLDAGVNAAAGSDFYPGPFAPLMGMQGMVTRTGWNGETWGANQRVTAAEALRINTFNGAYAAREETLKGSITAGKLADFVVLADDPTAIAPEKIKDIQVVRTVVGGTATYEA
jgi:predicted amidohydrolase YtcJ